MQDRLLAEHVKTLYWQSELVIISSPFLSVFMVISQWQTAGHDVLLIWLLAQILHSLIWNLFRRNYHQYNKIVENQAWLRKQYTILSILGCSVGLLYGLSVPLFWNEDAIESVMMICLILTGLNIAPFIGNAISFSVYLWVPILSMGPIVVKSMMVGGYFWLLSILIVMGIVCFLLYARRLNNTFNENFRLRIQNEKLAQSLHVEKELVEETSRDKSRFLAAVSHDLRQPLHALNLFLAHLAPRLKDESNHSVLEQARHSSDMMGEMLGELMDISHFDTGKIQVEFSIVALDEILQRCVNEMKLVADEAGLDLRLHRSATIYIKTDPILLQRMLRNLLSNAIHYTEQGGILLGVRLCKGFARIEVWDTGAGIAKDQFEHIFDEFHQLDNPERDRGKGLGLGLAIVKRLSTLLEHRVNVRSKLGRGSCFSIEMPVSTVSKIHTSDDTADQPDVYDVAGLFVMVIDDNREILQGMRTLLRSWDCEVLLAESEKELLEYLAAHEYPSPDVLLFDYRLREGYNGLQAVEAVRSHFHVNIPALIISGDVQPNVINAVHQSGCRWLEKPVQEGVLKQMLGELGKC